MSAFDFLAVGLADVLAEARGDRDGLRGRPPQSDEFIYSTARVNAAIGRMVEDGRAVLCVAQAIYCAGCRSFDIGPQHYGCACERRNTVLMVPGMFVVSGELPEYATPEFMPTDILNAVTERGIQIIDQMGRNISMETIQIQ